MDEEATKVALFGLFQQGVANRELVHGVALGLSAAGKTRVSIMGFFWDFMLRYENELSERQMDMVGDFCHDLLGQGQLEHFVRLRGDPEDPESFVRKVQDEAGRWKPPV